MVRATPFLPPSFVHRLTAASTVFPGDTHPWPLYHVDAVTHRDNAILPMSACGRLTDETVRSSPPFQTMQSLTLSNLSLAAHHDWIACCGSDWSPLPREWPPRHQRFVALYFSGGFAPLLFLFRHPRLLTLFSIPPTSQVTWVVLQFDTAKISESKITPEELRQKVGDLVFGHKAGYTIHRLVLVGTDIDVYDDKDIMWAFTTRCRPSKDEVRSRHFSPLSVFFSSRKLTLSSTLFRPFSRIARVSLSSRTCRTEPAILPRGARSSRTPSCPQSTLLASPTGRLQTSRSMFFLSMPSLPSVLFRSRPDIKLILSILQFVPRECQAESPRQLGLGRVCTSLNSAFAAGSTTHVFNLFYFMRILLLVFLDVEEWKSGNSCAPTGHTAQQRAKRFCALALLPQTEQQSTRMLYRARSVALNRPSNLSCSVCV